VAENAGESGEKLSAAQHIGSILVIWIMKIRRACLRAVSVGTSVGNFPGGHSMTDEETEIVGAGKNAHQRGEQEG